MTKPRILLIGKTGQVGTELERLLPALGDVFAYGRNDLDLTKPRAVRSAIRERQPDVIVNAAAYTAVDQAEKEEPLARTINAEAPGVMAEEARNQGALLVHYSTDYVFDGLKATAYVESDQTNPLSAYGRTKLAGEELIRASGANHLIFRTEWVYGRRGKNFLLTILRLAAERDELRIVRDQIGAPTWCRAIAEGTRDALRKLLGESGDRLAEVSGTYHMTANGSTSWFGFAEEIVRIGREAKADWIGAATSGRAMRVQRVVPISAADYPLPALRPANSVLSNARLERTFGVRLADWKDQLNEVFSG